MRYLVVSSWIGVGVLAVTAAVSAESVIDAANEEMAEHHQSVALESEKADELSQVELDAEMALARISRHCTILFNVDTGVPAKKINSDYQLVNTDGVPLTVGAPICAADGETALVTRRSGQLVPGDIRKVPITRLPEYQSFYSTYPEVKGYE